MLNSVRWLGVISHVVLTFRSLLATNLLSTQVLSTVLHQDRSRCPLFKTHSILQPFSHFIHLVFTGKIHSSRRLTERLLLITKSMKKSISLACVWTGIDRARDYLFEKIEMITWPPIMPQHCIRCDLWIIHPPTCFYKIILDLGSPLISARGEGGAGGVQSEKLCMAQWLHFQTAVHPAFDAWWKKNISRFISHNCRTRKHIILSISLQNAVLC